MSFWIYAAIWAAITLLTPWIISTFSLLREGGWTWREMLTPPWFCEGSEVMLGLSGVMATLFVVCLAAGLGDLRIPQAQQ
jgi:hypothetical protein